MSTTTTETTRGTVELGNWRAGVAGGIAGGLVMGALMVVMNVGVIAVAIPSLYTLAPPENPLVGLFVHVSHGATLGVAFAGLAGLVGADGVTKRVGLGVGWGVLTWVGFAALVMPLWLSAVGSPASPPFPNFAPPSLLWHAVYGLVLGGVYGLTADSI